MLPPFEITPKVLGLVSEISLLLGRYEGIHAPAPQPQLRRQNRIRTIKDSLAIEGNTLSLAQVSAIFEGKSVSGPIKEILEVQNAIRLYENLRTLKPTTLKNLLWAHGVLMEGLTRDAGKFRSGAVGILKGQNVSHIAPPAKQVPRLVEELLDFLKKHLDLSPLIKACVFHYEFEFIHPFTDGNGRMGRFWQSLILTHFHPAFEHIPVESLIKGRQAAYYRALEISDKNGNSTPFIEFSLEVIRDALGDFMDNLLPPAETTESRLNLAKQEFDQTTFSRKEYLLLFETISTATASRDLAWGFENALLEKTGTQATTRYRFKKRDHDFTAP
jgi:Fic family protein